MLAKTDVQHYSGNDIELGTACRKYYRDAHWLSLTQSDLDISRSMPEQTGENFTRAHLKDKKARVNVLQSLPVQFQRATETKQHVVM